jgi:AcrR family transcriptional regulator
MTTTITPPRPHGRDPEGTRRRILDAALEEFSAKGIAGARVDAIADRAGTNKRMLYHYFGSKEGLYRAVLHEGLAHQPETDARQSHRMVRLNDRFGDHRDWVRLLMWEALERGETGEIENEAVRRAGMERLVASIAADQADGILPADIDPEQLALSELAMALVPFAFPQLARLATGLDPRSRAFKKARREHLTRLAARVKQ